MDIRFRPSKDRGNVVIEPWLNARHSFSFGDYYDPKWIHFSCLRVINQDIVAPKGGFPTHPHRDMEIITYVLRGEISHRDSMGSAASVKPGEIQVMGAGTGVEHSEFNHSPTHELELLQIWLIPRAKNLAPFYAQKRIADIQPTGPMKLLVSPDGAHGSVTIRQDAWLWACYSDRAISFKHRPQRPGAEFWIQMVKGGAVTSSQRIGPGDGCGFSKCEELELSVEANSEFLLFEV
jgi:redox-sensitive bicupin YhaK (pirin superfamily)